MSAIPKSLPLHQGDHLSVAEFERRYLAMPDAKKAELIEGVVYMPSPVDDNEHGVPHFDFISLLGAYRAVTPGVLGGDNSTLRLLLGANMVQPDGYLRILPENGGKAWRGDDGYVQGAVDLIAEIAASSASYDLHEKLKAYERNGVREYIVWRTHDGAIDWFGRRGGKFKPMGPDQEGVLKSRVFPGLWIDAPALVADDYPKAYRTVQQGLASSEHARFVAKLQKLKK